MSNYHDFYREIFGELDFSITGYKSISETINDFLKKISKFSLLRDLDHLDFISYSYAQVSDINTWKLSPMSSEYPFYYKSFNDENNLLYTLSLYYDFKDFLKPLHGGGASRLIVSEIISKVFNRPTPYRVKIIDSKRSSVCYDEQLDVITFEISLQSLLKKGSEITLQELKIKFESDFFDKVVNSDRVPRLERKKNTFKIKDRRLMGDLFFEKIFDKKKIEIEIERLTNESKAIVCGNRANILNGSNDQDDTILKEWIKVIFGHGFLSIFSDRWVENIPSVTKVEINESEEITKKSIGTLIIGYSSDKEIDKSERALFRTIADKVSSVVTAQVVKDINEDLLAQAIKSAVSAIINRNYAHHIGSHVSRRASLEKILKRLGLNAKNGLYEKQIASIAKMRSRLEKYKDERSEFIASVTSSPVSQTFNFYTDLIRPITENTLLIDNIARNEGICYQKKNGGKLKACDKLSADENTLSQLVVRVFIHDDLISGERHEEQIRYDLSKVPSNYKEQRVIYHLKENNKYDSLSIPYYLRHADLQNTFYEEAEPVLKDFQVNMPGALGKHAIYSLLENYIRNVAKHSYNHKEHKGEPVEIILKIAPNDKASDKLKLILTDNISNDSVVDELNEKILKPITDKNIGMGIADMKICACLLAEKELSDENLRESLEAVSENENERLAYSLQLSKPKNVALIGVEKNRQNISEGIFFFEDLEAYLNSSSSNFQFAIVDGSYVEGKTLRKHKNRLPLRLLIITDKKKNNNDNNSYKYLNAINLEGQEKLLEWCWKQWVSSKTNEKRTHLSVYFEQSKNDSLTNKWLEIQQSNENQEDKPFSMTVHFKVKNSEISPDLSINDTKRHIFYDRHAGLIRKTQGKGIHFREDNFWELIDKNNPDFDLIASADINQDPFLLPYELVDAATTNILVIDERVAEMAHYGDSSDTHMNEALIDFGGFEKQNRIRNAPGHLFDACWASGIHVATHVCGKPVSNSIEIQEGDVSKKHYLDVMFQKGKNKITVENRTNVKLSNRKIFKINENDNNIEKFLPNNFHRQYDCLLIHRTKLKDLIENSFGENFLTELDISKIFVVTGGGVIDFLSDKKAVTVLPSNILHDYILGRRPSKYLLTKILR